jgi:hypothetical protein
MQTLSTLLLFALYLSGIPIAQAQLSGEVSLGGASTNKSQEEKRGNPQTKEITVTGLGENPQAAEKQAITDAVRQAVGAYIDANTLVENEEVVRDRILSVSDGFVKEYKVTSPARQRDDGLYEITVIAIVETKQVVQALKEMNLITGEVAGQNLWAEASTKVMNAQDAVAMLQAKIPEFIKSCVTLTPLDKEGKPMVSRDAQGNSVPSTAPAIVDEDASKDEATLTWYFEMGLDSKYYNQTVFPAVKQCLDAITGCSAKLNRVFGNSVAFNKVGFEIRDFISTKTTTNECGELPLEFRRIRVNADFYDKQGNGYGTPILIKNITNNFSVCEFLSYENSKHHLDFKIDGQDDNYEIWYERGLASLEISLIDENGDLISASSQRAWTPFQTRNFHQSNELIAVGPFTSNENTNESTPNFIFPLISKTQITLPIADLRKIKKVEVNIVPSNINLSLKPTN